MSDAVNQVAATEELLWQLTAHVDFVCRELCTYCMKPELNKADTEDYLSIVSDGAEKSNFVLYHFVTPVNDKEVLGIRYTWYVFYNMNH